MTYAQLIVYIGAILGGIYGGIAGAIFAKHRRMQRRLGFRLPLMTTALICLLWPVLLVRRLRRAHRRL